ncbi:MAG: CPBP family intramembrane metalloprotease [Rhizobiales bacterium]|nr:CPBP family intramembrane metalloprotease [Hyphomicrobiales bacterium]
MTESEMKPPGVWKFWGTLLWGILVFAAMGIGQIGVVAYFVFTNQTPMDAAAMVAMLGDGRTIALSVIAGLPGVLLVLWIATRLSRIPFAEYLGLEKFSWKYFLIGLVGLAVLSQGWDFVAKGVGHEVSPGFMGEVLKTARAQNALWLLVLSFCVAAPLTEELMTRGFLYRGWSESFLRPLGAIIVSSLVWTCMHLQYDAFFLAQVLSIGLLFGWLRYACGSIWVTIVLHGLNNLAATLQTMYLLSGS